MTTGPSRGSELDRRARVHAALGDPTRLAVVDRLTLGDLSPGELAESLGIPGNLVAHHLRTLERAGVVHRVRSEGDGRRVYVRLTGPVPDAGAQATAPRRVVFVCTRNSARSQLAAATWSTTSPVPAASAGTDPADAVHPLAVAAARARGLRIDGVRPAHLDDVLVSGDLVVAVCDNAHESLPGDSLPRLHWSVSDPVRIGTAEVFEQALADVQTRVSRLASVMSR